MAYCKQCGAKLDEGTRFCPSCGIKVQSSGEYIDLSDFGCGKKKMGQPREQVKNTAATPMKEASFISKLFWTIVIAIPLALIAYITQDIHTIDPDTARNDPSFRYLDSGKDWTDRIVEIIDFFSDLFK